jgi:hypothetical protein
MSGSPSRANGNGHWSNRETSPDRLAYVEQMLETITEQTTELQRLAALAAKASTIKAPAQARDAADRLREKR